MTNAQKRKAVLSILDSDGGETLTSAKLPSGQGSATKRFGP